MDKVRAALRGFVARSEAPVRVGDMIATFRSRTRRTPDSAAIQALIGESGENEDDFYKTAEFAQFVIERDHE